jgi:hypothetical protein
MNTGHSTRIRLCDEKRSVTGIGHKSVTVEAECANAIQRIVLKKKTLAD